MGLDQEILVLRRWRPECHKYEQILRKRKCYPLHAYINKWLVDTYNVNDFTWDSLPFGPYIEIPRMIMAQYCIALEKRKKPGGFPPLVRDEFEKLLTTDMTDKINTYVGGRCFYDRMFGDSLEQEDWTKYTDQEEDILVLRQALESPDDIDLFQYYASW